MNCEKCGQENNGSNKYCKKCGDILVLKNGKKLKEKSSNLITGISLFFSILIIIIIYLYLPDKNPPFQASQLGKISLGMNLVEVTLLLGKPDYQSVDENNITRYIYGYSKYREYYIKFDNREIVTHVCSENYNHKIFGLGVYDSEDEVIKKLGEPSNVSIDKDGFEKFVSYEKWNVAFRIEKGQVVTVCVDEKGKS